MKSDSVRPSQGGVRRRLLKIIVLGLGIGLVLVMAGFGFWFFRDRPAPNRDRALEAKSITGTFRNPWHIGITYYLFAPPGGRQVRAPLIVYLHGHDGGAEGVPPEVRSLVESDVQKEFPSWVLAPRVPIPYWWTSGSREALSALIRKTVNEYPVDPERVYIIGFSLGSTAAMHMIDEHPKYFAAAVPLSGRPFHPEQLRSTPIWQMIGEKDNVYSPRASEEMVRRLQELGADARFTKIENKGHGILSVLSNREIYEWLFARKNPDPGAFTSPEASRDSP